MAVTRLAIEELAIEELAIEELAIEELIKRSPHLTSLSVRQHTSSRIFLSPSR